MNQFESGAVIDMNMGHNSATPAPIGADALRVAAQAALTALENLHEIDTETECITIDVRDEIEALRAALASTAQPAPAAVAEPVAWLHDDPQRYDVIHAEVKDLLVKSRDAAGYLHRPLDKSAHYTIPLYTAPAPAAQGDALDQGVREELSIGKAINRAARDLPEGWEIRIDLERHAGVVFLIDTDGNETMSEGGELFSDQINAAIDAARSQAKEWA